MPGKDKIEYSGVVPVQEAAQYLESLARGLRERVLLLESGDSSVSIDVPDDVKVGIEASVDVDKGKASIDVSLGWRQRRDEEVVSPGLLIVAGRPAENATIAE
jgi:amphi-Trp domain-containing protein